MTRSPVADLVRALAVLKPADDDARRRVAARLGFEVPEPPAEEREKPRDQVIRPAPAVGQAQVGTPTVTVSGSPAEPRGQISSSPSSEVAATLIPDLTSARRPPRWLERVEPLPEPASTPLPPPAAEPLLEPQWTRSLLSGALATLTGEGPLDVERLVREVARGVPLVRVPRRPWPTLAQGAQVLVDRSEAMLPFAADQDWLIEQLQAVVGRERLQVLFFEGCPAWGAGPGSKRRWKPYSEHHTPPAGVAVLLVTDLGIGRPGPGRRAPFPADWLDFATHTRQAGCPLVAFVPYGPARWPAELQRCIQILPWDRATSARTVRMTLGRALRLPAGAHG